MENKTIKAPIGLLIIAIFGIITIISMIKTLQKYTNIDDISYSEKSK